MVTFRQFSPPKVILLPLFALCLALLLAGCGPTVRVATAPDFKPSSDQDVIYVAPFVNTLVPETFAETAFNDFVDTLNSNRAQTGGKWFLIIKDELKDVDPAWLAKRPYVTGELWSYIENSGCCSTELRVKARVSFYEPQRKEPSIDIAVPMESFFEHDRSTLEAERARLARRLARVLADQFMHALSNGGRQ